MGYPSEYAPWAGAAKGKSVDTEGTENTEHTEKGKKGKETAGPASGLGPMRQDCSRQHGNVELARHATDAFGPRLTAYARLTPPTKATHERSEAPSRRRGRGEWNQSGCVATRKPFK
ncbi:hypothetical protein GCM10007860_22410 [Chitiniphilus shinanonensis]|uniref:Uncharacterized protein n=1 Tax=Chitiniphilus shinanonensis TaxID=553088 RepID=A0ABQ6BTH6_9NEIS|nr:hypothetical protein GCM10007860_22410 [Chitiniphilus shinanonensis]